MMGALLVAQGIAGGGVLQTDDGGDIAGVDSLDILAVVGVHLQHDGPCARACFLVALSTAEPVFSVPE